MPKLEKIRYQERPLRSWDEWRNHHNVSCWEWSWAHSTGFSVRCGKAHGSASTFEISWLNHMRAGSWSVIFLSIMRELFFKSKPQYFMLVVCLSHSHFQNQQESPFIGVRGWNMFSQYLYVEVLTPKTSEFDCVLVIGCLKRQLS